MRTTIQQSDNPSQKFFKKPVYDHALVSNETSNALPNDPMKRVSKDLGIVEFDHETHWKSLNDWDKVIRGMSDHRPVWFRVDCMAADFD